jgi:hypothetical protein
VVVGCTQSKTALIRMLDEVPGTNCATGGKSLSYGVDQNSDGSLSNDEVTSTQYLCNGSAGPAGSRGETGPVGTPGAAGTFGTQGEQGPTGASGQDGKSALLVTEAASAQDCPAGGTVFMAGVDDDADGVLDLPAEVDSTAVVCNGANGSNGSNGADGMSVAVNATPFSGSQGTCTNGGVKVEAGPDANADGTPDTVLNTTYVCNGTGGADGNTGAAGASVAVKTTAFSGNQNGCSNGGVTVEAGIDTDGSGALDGSETATSTSYVCNGSNGSNSNQLIGVDFGINSSNTTPLNWNKSDGSANLTSLLDQSGVTTAVGLSFSTTPGSFNANVLPATVPMASVDLSNIGGNIYSFAGSMVLDFTGLTPGAAYGVYVLGLRGGATYTQNVSIEGVQMVEGDQMVSFTQNAPADTLSVNDQVGSNMSLLTSAGKYVSATPSGTIKIRVGSSGYFLAGVALEKL